MTEWLENIALMWRRASGPILRAMEAVFVIGLGLTMSKLAWLVVEPGGAVSPSLPVRTIAYQAPRAVTQISVDTSRLIHENPFGTAVMAELDVPDAPETSLNLKLRGVRASSLETDGIAWITTPNNQTRAFAPGDVILDGVTLHRIYADRVTLKKGGLTEALLMEGGAGLLSVLTTPGGQAGSGPGRADESSARIARADLVSSLTIDPVHRGQEFIGYRIGSRGDTNAMVQAGLKSGDVVIGVDGADIDDVPPSELARKFSDPSPVQLTIDRDGQTIRHTLAPEEAR